jgi:hypothetical protein
VNRLSPIGECTTADIYGWVGCTGADPCLTGHGTTLYALTECGAGNPPIAEWCYTRADHPACVNVVAVPPPTAPPSLPPTGATASIAALALLIAVAGVLLLAVVTRRGRAPIASPGFPSSAPVTDIAPSTDTCVPPPAAREVWWPDGRPAPAVRTARGGLDLQPAHTGSGRVDVSIFPTRTELDAGGLDSVRPHVIVRLFDGTAHASVFFLESPASPGSPLDQLRSWALGIVDDVELHKIARANSQQTPDRPAPDVSPLPSWGEVEPTVRAYYDRYRGECVARNLHPVAFDAWWVNHAGEYVFEPAPPAPPEWQIPDPSVQPVAAIGVFGYAIETAQGTYSAPTQAIEFVSQGLTGMVADLTADAATGEGHL